MIVLDGFEEPASYRGGVLAIGNFDGVHRGHQHMLAVLREQADRHRVPAVVMTFNPPPVQLLRPELVPPRLTTSASKAKLLRHYGVDCLIDYPHQPRVCFSLTAKSVFFEQIILTELDVRGLVEGPEFFGSGKDRQGDVQLLTELCQTHSRELTVIEPQSIDGMMIFLKRHSPSDCRG